MNLDVQFRTPNTPGRNTLGQERDLTQQFAVSHDEL